MKTKNNALKSFLNAIFAGAMLAIVPAATEAANIVLNPGFEDINVAGPIPTSTLQNWTTTETALVNEVDGTDTTVLYGLAPHGGSIAAAFFSATNAVGAGASLTQALTTVAGQAYNLSFWLANPIDDPQNLNNAFSVMWDGNLISLSGTNLVVDGVNTYKVQGDETNWYQVTATGLVASGASTNLVFSARNNDWATLVDDVEVSAVPDNGPTFALLGIALTGLTLYSRKAQRLATVKGSH